MSKRPSRCYRGDAAGDIGPVAHTRARAPHDTPLHVRGPGTSWPCDARARQSCDGATVRVGGADGFVPIEHQHGACLHGHPGQARRHSALDRARAMAGMSTRSS